MERLTDRLSSGAAFVRSETGEEGVGYFTTQRRLPELISRLAAYEDTGLVPEEITAGTPECVFYCNRRCNLDGDWCAEGPGCPWECDPARVKSLLQLEKCVSNHPLILEELRKLRQNLAGLPPPSGGPHS